MAQSILPAGTDISTVMYVVLKEGFCTVHQVKFKTFKAIKYI